jgi:uncharacterized C2H2 Zn-finger protein
MESIDSLRKLKCKTCGTRFRYPKRLEKHQQIAHNKKKEKCRACDTEFDYSEDLRKHKKVCKGKV